MTYDPARGEGRVGEVVFSTHNLAAHLAEIDPEQWDEYVAWHFSHLASGPPEIPTDFERVRARLRVRLASDAWLGGLGDACLSRRVAEDLHEVLMVSLEELAVAVPSRMPGVWGQQPNGLWEQARRNTLWDEPYESCLVAKADGRAFTWVRGSWWAASRLLDLGRSLSADHRHGAVAMVPVRDALLYRELQGRQVAASVWGMLELGVGFYLEGPGSVSPHLYWLHQGELRRGAAVGEGGVVWDQQLRELLEALAAGEAAAG